MVLAPAEYFEPMINTLEEPQKQKQFFLNLLSSFLQPPFFPQAGQRNKYSSSAMKKF
jgi:hypothetical protein